MNFQINDTSASLLIGMGISILLEYFNINPFSRKKTTNHH
jgi:hypothetical protein